MHRQKNDGHPNILSTQNDNVIRKSNWLYFLSVTRHDPLVFQAVTKLIGRYSAELFGSPVALSKKC